MAELNLSLPDLFRRAFGIERGLPYDGSKLNEEETTKIEFDEIENVSDEGTEFLTVRNELNAKLPDGRAIFMPVQIADVLLPNEPTIAFSKRKRIIETALVGSKRKGTVKELISSEDWEITIRGIAVNYESKIYYPEDQVADLIGLDAREESLEIKSALTSLLGIYRIVIKSFRLTEMVGIQHAQAYEFQCVSDEDFILEIE